MLKAYTSSLLHTGDEVLKNHAIIVKEDKVVEILPVSEIPEQIHLSERNADLIIPGLADLQIYGGGGVLFSAHLTKEALDTMTNGIIASGTTTFLVTLATNSPEVFNKAIEIVKANPHSSRPGIHFEGPYLNPVKKGAHVEAYIRKPGLKEVKELLARAEGVIKMITLAPELCSPEVIDLLLENDIIISAGHSNASYIQGTEGFNRGIQTSTHLFNAMSPLHHRDTGLPGAVYNHPRAMASIIPDGIHVDYATIEISKKIMGDRLFLITDAVEATTEEPYIHIPAEGRFTLPDGTLSGAAISMLQGVKNCIKHCNISMEEAVKMGSSIPRSLLKSQKPGNISAGNSADFLILDKEWNLLDVIFEGKISTELKNDLS